MTTEKEQKKFQKILARNEKFFARQHKKYARGLKREIKRVYKLLKKETNSPHSQDIYYYMRHYSQYTASSSKEVETIMKEIGL